MKTLAFGNAIRLVGGWIYVYSCERHAGPNGSFGWYVRYRFASTLPELLIRVAIPLFPEPTCAWVKSNITRADSWGLS